MILSGGRTRRDSSQILLNDENRNYSLLVAHRGRSLLYTIALLSVQLSSSLLSFSLLLIGSS